MTFESNVRKFYTQKIYCQAVCGRDAISELANECWSAINETEMVRILNNHIPGM